MPTYLSQEWLDLQRALAEGLPERPGATARVQFVITGAPGCDVRYHQTTVDGRLLDLELGDDPNAEVTLTQTYAVAADVATGALDANAAFMQGRVKVVGPMGPMMALIPLTQSAEYLALLATLTAQTTY